MQNYLQNLKQETPAIAEAIALGAAVDYLSGIGMDKIYTYESELTGYLFEQLGENTTSKNLRPQTRC